MNEEIARERRTEEVIIVEAEAESISEEQVKTTLKKVKEDKAVGPDNISAEVWKCLGKLDAMCLTRCLETDCTSTIFKNNGSVQCGGNYQGIKQTMKSSERDIENRLRAVVEIGRGATI